MRTSAKLITALSVTGLAVVAGSAFTSSNTFSFTEGVSGYGESVATGATITAMSKTLLEGDDSRLASVVFTSSTNVADKTATMTLKDADGPIHAEPYACILGEYTSGTMTITCSIPADGTPSTNVEYPLLSTFTTTGLTIL